MNIKQLFEYIVISSNPKLDALINDTLSRYSSSDRVELFDDEAASVSAAGDASMQAWSMADSLKKRED